MAAGHSSLLSFLLSKLKIGAKLLLAPGICLILLVVMAASTYISLQEINGGLNNIHDVRFARFKLIGGITDQARDAHTKVFRLLSWSKSSYPAARLEQLSKDIEKNLAEIKKSLDGFSENAKTEEEKKVLTAAITAFSSYTKRVNGVVSLADSDIFKATTMMEPADKSFDTLLAELASVRKNEENLSGDAYRNVGNVIKQSTQVNIALVIVSLLAVLIVTFLVRREVLRAIKLLRDAAASLSNGDLSARLQMQGRDEIAQTVEALQNTLVRLSTIVKNVKLAADDTMVAAHEIAEGNMNLSTRTEMQAVSLQKTSHTVAHLNDTLQATAGNAREASQLALDASKAVADGGAAVKRVIATMQEINDSSKRIVDIISVINGISFQTNILALNAAVEAARAGEHGRGFAVVASEVRNLATKSATAAKEIEQLISESVGRTTLGTKLVLEAGKVIENVVRSVDRVTEIVQDISQANSEQSNGIAHINRVIAEMDDTTQQNAALVEQAATAATALNSQATQLTASVSFFKLE